GGGPTGLMLACELRLAGGGAVVLERLTEPTGLSKALGLSGRAVDLLDHRGLVERFQASQPANAHSIRGLFHFAGSPIDVRRPEGEHTSEISVGAASRQRAAARGARARAPCRCALRP